MMNPPEPWPKRVSVEHVYLGHTHLNARDHDAFASLLDEEVTLRGPEGTAAFGRAAVTAAEQSRRFTHMLEDLGVRLTEWWQRAFSGTVRTAARRWISRPSSAFRNMA
ncbi:hypothetical protein HYE82_07535 [Streptomyces sp. BR123]|uniref:hypothetical protein n=1 Tax=Streptomyces sp. BR123 TaxID=2749828 RepID=UPI0015C49FEF|nr:hypothetical protein [Streptomyces sp. BR123]NXY94240.1 hypothetical protein [Streptomyces sp. BR123]